jgi:hypothetical protein
MNKEARCGICRKWMTDSCFREYHVKGRRRGPDMNSWPCGQYVRNEILYPIKEAENGREENIGSE